MVRISMPQVMNSADKLPISGDQCSMVDSVNAGRAGGDVICGLDTIVLDA